MNTVPSLIMAILDMQAYFRYTHARCLHVYQTVLINENMFSLHLLWSEFLLDTTCSNEKYFDKCVLHNKKCIC